jgi:hypothetical protein
MNDHRKKLWDLLQQYQPTDVAEVVFKKEILEFVAAHSDCFERTLAVGHITASA